MSDDTPIGDESQREESQRDDARPDDAPKDAPKPKRESAKRRKRARDEDRYVEAMRAIDDPTTEAFLLLVVQRDPDKPLPALKPLASDDYSWERIFNIASMELPTAFPLMNEVIIGGDDDEPDDDDE